MGRIERLTNVESISVRPSSTNRVSPSQRVSAWRIASASFDFWLVSVSLARSYGSSSSSTGRPRSCRAARRSSDERPRISLSILYSSAMRVSASLAIGVGPAVTKPQKRRRT